MYSEVHTNAALYRPQVEVGSRYRQIAVVEKEQFEVRIFEGDVAQLEPKFIANSTDAEIHFCSTLDEATQEAQKEFQASVAEGWQPYNPHVAA